MNSEVLDSIINRKVNATKYDTSKNEAIEMIKDWSKTKEASKFLTSGEIVGHPFPNDKLFEVYSNSISNEVNPINLIDEKKYKDATIKDSKIFSSSNILNKDMKRQIKFTKKELESLIDSNGLWSKSSIYYQNIDSTGHVDKYCEYDVISKRTFEIPLGKLYLSAIKSHSLIRETLLDDMKNGRVESIEEIAKGVPELQSFIKDRFGIIVYEK